MNVTFHQNLHNYWTLNSTNKTHPIEAFTSSKVRMMPKSSQSSTAAASTAATSIIKGIGPVIESNDEMQSGQLHFHGRSHREQNTNHDIIKEIRVCSVEIRKEGEGREGGELKKLRCDSDANSGRCAYLALWSSD